jgi:membrane-bound metal-dependent hydrolase YbcI (DUF457 family)
MYAVNHAATALLLKKNYPAASMFWLLIAVQFIELLWVLFNYLGIEHFTVENSVVHLGYLPWSHSILSTAVFALAAGFLIGRGFKNKPLGIAVGLGILSHILLDLLTHEPDIRLSPFSTSPAFGLNIQSIPILAILVETGWGVFCWWYFKGSRRLLAAIIILNMMNIPTIFHLNPGTVALIDRMHFILPSFILFQILLTWYFVWLFSRERRKPAV